MGQHGTARGNTAAQARQPSTAKRDQTDAQRGRVSTPKASTTSAPTGAKAARTPSAATINKLGEAATRAVAVAASRQIKADATQREAAPEIARLMARQQAIIEQLGSGKRMGGKQRAALKAESTGIDQTVDGLQSGVRFARQLATTAQQEADTASARATTAREARQAGTAARASARSTASGAPGGRRGGGGTGGGGGKGGSQGGRKGSGTSGSGKPASATHTGQHAAHAAHGLAELVKDALEQAGEMGHEIAAQGGKHH